MKLLFVLLYICLSFSVFANNSFAYSKVSENSRNIVEKRLLDKLHTLIKLNDNGKSFVFGNDRLIIFSPMQTKHKVISDQYIQFVREFGFIEYKYSIKKINTYTVKGNPGKFEIHADLKLVVKQKKNCQGVKMGLVPEIKIEKIVNTALPRTVYFPDANYDYYNAMNVDCDENEYNFSEVIYVSADDDFSDRDILSSLKKYVENGKNIQDERYSLIRMNTYLETQGYISYGGVFFKKNDLTKLKNLKAGLVFVNSKWISTAEHNANVQLKTAYNTFISNPKDNLQNILIALKKYSAASESEKVKVRKEVENYLLLGIQNINQEKELVNFRNLFTNNSLFDVINKQKIIEKIDTILNAKRNERAAAQKAQREIENRRMKKFLEEKYNNLQILLEIVENKARLKQFQVIEKMKSSVIYKEEKSLKELMNKYIFLLASRSKKLNSINLLLQDVDENDYKYLLEQVFRQCDKCNNGIRKCYFCDDTKICKNCNGKGGYYVDSISDGRRYIKCSSVCEECKSPKKCAYCRGTGIRLNEYEHSSYFKQYRTMLLKRLNNLKKEVQNKLNNLN